LPINYGIVSWIEPHRGIRVKKAVAFLFFLALSGAAAGKTLYVTDTFKITLRSGESTGHKIVRMLPSGAALDVLGQNPDTGYTRVRYSGQEGYVLTRQLMNAPSARDQVTLLTERLRELQEAPGKLSSKLTNLEREHKDLQSAHEELKQIREQLDTELKSIRRTAADAMRINEERNELRKTVANLTREREELKQQNRDLGNQTAQQWFMIGAGVIILGIVLGLLLPHLRFQRRKSTWGTL
jgi:SH3 domain protein